jgi:hypothetical protein
MAVSVWLTVVLYSSVGIAGLHAKKGKHNGLRDVTGIVVTDLPYSDGCLCFVGLFPI